MKTRDERRVEELEKVVVRELADSRERFEPKLATEDRGQDQDLVARVGEVTETETDGLPHSLRDAQPRRRGLARRGEAALLRQQADDLAQEEGVSFGLRVDRSDKAVGNLGSRGQADEVGDIVAREPGDREHARDGLSTQGHERSRQRTAACELRIAVPRDDEDASLRELARKELQQDQGRRVGCVQIVEHEHEWLPRGRPPQEAQRWSRTGESERYPDPASAMAPAPRPPVRGRRARARRRPLRRFRAPWQARSGLHVLTYARIDWHHGQ